MKNANGDDWREELYLKVRSMREMCLPHLHELYQTTEDKLQHQESLLQQQRSDEFEKLKRFKTTLEQMIYFLSQPKSKILPQLKHNIAYCEKQIMDLLMKHGPKQLPQSQTIHGMQQNASSSKLGSRLEPGQGSGLNNGNGGDWQEQVFQKIQSIKGMYLAELNEIYKRIVNYQQHNDSIPQQQRPDHVEKLIQFKTMLERMMQFLTVSKTSIMPALKDKVAYYEKHIIDFLNKYRPRKTVQQGQLPQSQTIQDKSHDNQTNPKMKSMSMQVSGTRAQESSLPYMQNNVVSSLPRVSAPQQNIPSFIPASSLESGQGNALNYGQQVCAMGSMQQNTSQQVNNGSAAAQSGLWKLQSNVNQTQKNIPSFIPASSLESGQRNALNYGQQVLTMGSMLQKTSQQVKNGSASAQSGLWTLHSNVNQTQLSSILIQNQQQQDTLMELKRQFQYRQMQQQELLQLLQQQQQMPQQMTQQLKQQLQYCQMQQQQLLQQVNQLQQHLQARQKDQSIMQQLQQHQIQQRQQHQIQQRQQPQMQQQQQNMSSSIHLMQQRQKPQMQQENMSSSIHVMQQRQQPQMQQENMSSSIHVMQQRQQPQMQQQNMSSSIHVMQQCQQPQMKQQNMSSSIPASNLESGQGSGLNNGNGSDLQNMSSSVHVMQQPQMQQQNMSSSIPASNLELGQGSGLNNGNGSDLQEELFQKFKYMKETYLGDLKELYERLVAKVQQETLPPQEISDKFVKQTEFKMVLEHIIRFLSVSKRTTSPASKDMLDFVESKIILYLNAPSHRPAEQGQLPQT